MARTGPQLQNRRNLRSYNTLPTHVHGKRSLVWIPISLVQYGFSEDHPRIAGGLISPCKGLLFAAPQGAALAG